MGKYVLKRIVLMLFTFLIIISMCFILVKLLPNKPAKQFGKDMQLIEMRREALGYNKPLLEQYVCFSKLAGRRSAERSRSHRTEISAPGVGLGGDGRDVCAGEGRSLTAKEGGARRNGGRW